LRTPRHNDYQQGQPISREAVSISKQNEAILLPFQVIEVITVAGGQLSLTGKNAAFIQTLIPNPIVGRGFDDLFPYELGDRLGDPVTQPTAADPIYVRRSTVECLIYPATIVSVLAVYYTYPTEADFTITADANLLPVYTSVAEMEWNDAEMVEIAYRIIREGGINIEKGDAVAYANQVIGSGR